MLILSNAHNNSIILLMAIAGGAGIVGTGLGGVIGLLFRKSNNKVISCVLNVAAGVMISIVCFDLIPEAEKLVNSNTFIWILGLITGFIIIFGLSQVLDKLTKKKKNSYCNNYEDVQGKRLVRTGVIMVFAISLHNFPEGMAIGSTGSIEGGFGKAILIAILLALHNVPEGMAISVPLITGGMPPAKAILLTTASGAVTLLGAIFGYLLGGISPALTAISLAVAGGAMLYITFAEILPESLFIYSGKITALFLLAGLVLGITAIYIGGFQ